MKTPVLMITWNRLSFTKKALYSLLEVRGAQPIIIDNGSTDGTAEWLRSLNFSTHRPLRFLNSSNAGIARAFNQFLSYTTQFDFCGKIDNDTIVEPDWLERMLPHMKHADIVQSKHAIIPATHPGGWNGFTAKMKKANGLIYNHYVGGSGILFHRKNVNSIPETESKIMGWRRFQELNPALRKAFAPDVSIELLDTNESGTNYPEEYQEYYKSTGRL